METKCPVCGAPLDGGRCDYCGYAAARPAQEEIPAPVPVEIETDGNRQTASGNDGFNYTEIIPGVSRKSKTTALLLCIFLGGLGAHRFYVGKAGTGILYLLTGGFLGIGWIIDIIRIAVGSFRDEFDLPLRV